MTSIVMEEYELLEDSKYRNYMTMVDRALKAFESTTEWADLIAALGKLNKVLVAHMKYPIVPRRILISKRLAQCMHPALPSGVHLKALDTYDIIFKCMGTNRLAQELFLYSAGLFPLLSHAAMNVRSALLTVYETHFVPLGERLRPALNGLLIGVLPGLEEGTDHFDRTNRLLESICEASHPPVFYGALWECVASNQSIRLPAITFVLSHVDKRSRRGEGGGECTPVADRQSYILGNDRDVTVRAACAAVQDSSVLVQRNALDLLLVLFPIHEKTLGQPEMVSVVTAACCVLLRRDMSLNRRLFGWLLGTNSPASAANKKRGHVRQDSVSSINSEAAADDSDLPSYFEFYARHLLVDAVRAILRNSLSAARNEQKPDLKPFRLLSTLFDKAEIGQTIVDDVIIDVFRTMFHSYHMDVGSGCESGRRAVNGRARENGSAALQRQKKNRQELVKSANMLFGEMDSGYIWDFCGSAFERASSKKYRINDSHTSDVNEIGSDETSTVIEMCAVVDFLLDVISIETYVETHSEHLPALFKKVATVLKDRCEALTPKEITRALALAKKLLSKVQPAWNAWDVAKEAAKGASDTDSVNTAASDAGAGGAGSVESANAMWNEIGKENMSTDANASPEVGSDASVSPEVGKEATESLSPQNSDGVRSPHFPLQRQTTHAARVHQAHEALMQECSSAFQDFFVRLMSTRLFPSGFSIDAYVSKMVRRPNDTLDDRTRHLETLLEASDDAEQLVTAMQNEEEEEKAVQELMAVELPLDRDALEELSEALATTCQVLVDLSTVPTVSISNDVATNTGVKSDVGCPPSNLPAWLQYLLACSCLLTHRHAQFQLQCVSTLLEIVGLLQSTMSVTKARRRSKGQAHSTAPAAATAFSSPSVGSTSGEASYAIVMMPLIKEQHYQCVVKQTVVPQVIAAKLWDGLGGMDPVFHLRCVSLLYQLHNLVPNPKAIERILARSLERENDGCTGSNVVDSYQRFSTLWHLSRDLDVKTGGGSRRNFDICLLKMLDNLNLSTGPLRALSQSWLVHAMARGDIARLMEPLFITLLDPSTARVSVLHCKVEQLEGVESADIFAVTTLGREVVYHVAAAAADGADRAKRLFALHKFRQRKSEDAEAAAAGGADSIETTSSGGAASKRPELNSMPLAVNPFALVPPEVDEYENFTRGYGPTHADSSSSSSGSDSDSEAEETTQGSSPVSELGSRKMDSMTSNASQPFRRSASTDSVVRSLSIHPLHSHLLLYCQVSDSRQILYTMECIKNIIKTNPRLAICTLSTTNLNPSSSGASGSYGSRSAQIQMLLARHRKSVFGKNFVGSVPSENMATYRNATLVEVLLSTLLYYLRSYYPNLAQTKLSNEEIKANREVQLMAIDILYLLVAELISVVQDNGRAYATYIADLFSRCKVQKVVLHSLLAGINDMRDSPKKKDEAEKMAFTDSVLAFNEIYSNQHGVSASERISNYSEAFQVQVLRLLLSLVVLEQAINQQRGGEQLNKLDPAGAAPSKPATPTPAPSMSATGSNNLLRYHNDHVIPDQPMFLAAVVSALRQEKMRHLHSHWTSLVTSTLPFLGKSLSQTVLEVTAQLSRNLENLAPFYAAASEGRASRDVERSFGFIPADYVVTQLEALTMIYHYCLLDQAGNQAVVNTSFSSQPSHVNPAAKGGGSSNAEAAMLGGEILTNLLHVFLSNTETNTLAARNLETPMSMDTMAIARKILLSTLPKLVNTSTILWMNLGADASARSSKRSLEPASILVGTPKTVKARLLDLLSPIAKSHTVHFLSAVGIVWQEKRDVAAVSKANSPLPVCNVDQRNLVGLCGSIRSLPVVFVISTVRQVIKAPPNITILGGKDSSSLEISVLQFFYAFLAQCSPDQVFESWSSLSGLLRDCLALAPPAIFLALSIVNQFVHRSPSPLTDRKDQKELQDIVGRLVDASAQIAGSCLEQTTWLRRNLEVNPQLLRGESEVDEKAASALPSMPLAPILAPVAPELLHLSDAAPRPPSRSPSSTSSISEEKRAMTAFSVPALALLGELLAPLLDIIYHSDEKEKVVPLLYSVMDYVVPYLRNHSRANLPSYRACSKLLAALSEYQYTRRAWKKDGMELLLDAAFFQTDLVSLAQWRVTVDNLMTHDKTTFKELMTKISAISQSSSLSLFSSKEQEMEQRALLLRRLAFVIFCSDVDQYQKQMPDIQERMVESLRTIPCSAEVRAAVFLCFRVVLVRMSAAHVTSMWPLIITEMVQIFSDLEQELSTDSEEWSSHLKRMSTLDSAWVMTAGYDGLAAHNSPAWMSLYLAVCKLLDLALVLPAHVLPQFQMYRWAFVSEGGSEAAAASGAIVSAAAAAASVHNHNGDLSADDGVSHEGLQHMHLPQQDFVPYVVRVAKLLLHKMDNKVEASQLAEGQPQLTMTSITSLDDLAPFFASICDNVTRQIARNDGGGGGGSSALSSDVTERIDRIIEADFLEALPRPVSSKTAEAV